FGLEGEDFHDALAAGFGHAQGKVHQAAVTRVIEVEEKGLQAIEAESVHDGFGLHPEIVAAAGLGLGGGPLAEGVYNELEVHPAVAERATEMSGVAGGERSLFGQRGH